MMENPILQNIICVFIGGGFGSVARYGLMMLTARLTPGSSFPYPTLAVNLLGALIIGILLEVLALRTQIGGPAKFLLVTGFLGGFTTFSAFALDSALLIERGDILNVALYITASVAGTIGAVFLGSFLARIVI